MITCPSCNHQNPEGSLQCENCYTPLPATTSCPNCGASVQADATFCGQCGFNLQAESPSVPQEETVFGTSPDISQPEIPLPDEIPLSAGSPNLMPETSVSEPLEPIESPWDDREDETVGQSELPTGFPDVEPTETATFAPDIAETEFGEGAPVSLNGEAMPFPEQIVELETPETSQSIEPDLEVSFDEPAEPEAELETEVELEAENPAPEIGLAAAGAMASATQLQVQKATLLHLQSNTTIEISSNLDVVHFGKPNGQIPPDVDVSGFPDSEVVSRVHADIRIEGDVYYVEDTGSSNGTYVNHAPLQKGNRHRLRTGDRIALGKGDLVSFIFQLS